LGRSVLQRTAATTLFAYAEAGTRRILYRASVVRGTRDSGPDAGSGAVRDGHVAVWRGALRRHAQRLGPARIWWMLCTFGFDNACVLNSGQKKWTVGSPLRED
jgi:3-mercaptopyruvate sulfurtransferase SseA